MTSLALELLAPLPQPCPSLPSVLEPDPEGRPLSPKLSGTWTGVGVSTDDGVCLQHWGRDFWVPLAPVKENRAVDKGGPAWKGWSERLQSLEHEGRS